jgi:hypothetical protein
MWDHCSEREIIYVGREAAGPGTVPFWIEDKIRQNTNNITEGRIVGKIPNDRRCTDYWGESHHGRTRVDNV